MCEFYQNTLPLQLSERHAKKKKTLSAQVRLARTGVPSWTGDGQIMTCENARAVLSQWCPAEA